MAWHRGKESTALYCSHMDIVILVYVTLSAIPRAYLYDWVESVRNNQLGPHSFRGTCLRQWTIDIYISMYLHIWWRNISSSSLHRDIRDIRDKEWRIVAMKREDVWLLPSVVLASFFQFLSKWRFNVPVRHRYLNNLLFEISHKYGFAHFKPNAIINSFFNTFYVTRKWKQKIKS